MLPATTNAAPSSTAKQAILEELFLRKFFMSPIIAAVEIDGTQRGSIGLSKRTRLARRSHYSGIANNSVTPTRKLAKTGEPGTDWLPAKRRGGLPDWITCTC